MHQSSNYTNLALLVPALLILLMLLPAASLIHCLNKKKKDKGKDKPIKGKAAKVEEKKVHVFIPKLEIIPKKFPAPEQKDVKKEEKKPVDSKGHSPKENKPLQAQSVQQVIKPTESAAKGKDAAKLSYNEDALKFPVGASIGQFVVAATLGAG